MPTLILRVMLRCNSTILLHCGYSTLGDFFLSSSMKISAICSAISTCRFGCVFVFVYLISIFIVQSNDLPDGFGVYSSMAICDIFIADNLTTFAFVNVKASVSPFSCSEVFCSKLDWSHFGISNIAIELMNDPIAKMIR